MSDTISIPISLLLEVRNDLSEMPTASARSHLEIIDRLIEGKCPVEDTQELLVNYWEQ